MLRKTVFSRSLEKRCKNGKTLRYNILGAYLKFDQWTGSQLNS